MHELVDFLKQSELFHDLSHEEIDLLLPLIRLAHYEKSDFIVKEEEKGDELFLIKSGSVEILKKDREQDTFYRLGLLHPGEWFGEMAALRANTRLASARAVEKTEVMVIHLKDLEQLARKSASFSKILKSIVINSTQWLETANEMIVKSMKHELKAAKAHDHMGRFIVHLFILLTIFVYTLKFFDLYGAYSKTSQFAASAFIISFAISCVLLVKLSHYPLAFYGLSMKNWRQNCFEAVLFSIPVMLLILGFKWMLIHTVPEFEKLSLFHFGTKSGSFLQKAYGHFFAKPQNQVSFHIILTVYVILIPLQEFIARGCLQSSLRNFFTAPNRALLAILTSNLLFGLFHSLKTFTFALSALILGMFWGWLYERQKTIIGPCISHALIGVWAFGILNYQVILIY